MLIKDLRLSTRARNALRLYWQTEVATFAARMTIRAIIDLQAVGITTLIEIMEVLQENGLKLKPDSPPLPRKTVYKINHWLRNRIREGHRGTINFIG